MCQSDADRRRALQCIGGIILAATAGAGTLSPAQDNPELCLNAVGGDHFTEGDTIVVSVDMGVSAEPICAAQLFLQYDTNALQFESISPGGGVFVYEVYQSVDAAAGTIDYLVVTPDDPSYGTYGPATVATITFTAIAGCQTPGVRFRPHNPPTRLGEAGGSEVCPAGHVGPDGECGVLVDPCNTGTLFIDGDGVIDLWDYEAFYKCLAGEQTTCCEVFDANSDGVIDLLDWGAFQVAFGGGP